VVAGCDIDADARARFAETWESTWPGLATYDDYREMFAGQDLDIACVATPDHLHMPVVLAAIEAGVKAIFCEKPFATTLADADAMIAAIERTGTVVNVNNTRRFMPAYVAAREAVRAGTIGALTHVSIAFGGPRSMLWRNHAHFLDLFSYLAESDPAWVVADLEPGFEDYGTAYKGDGGRNPDLEPGVNAHIAYANGVRGSLAGWKAMPPGVFVAIFGTEGWIQVDDRHATIWMPDGSTRPIMPQGRVQGFQAGLMDLIHGLETGEPVQSPPREARKTVALIEAILASQAGGNVRVPVDNG
jgi:predicted dehydrogenase